jgi:hypothetical protein
MSVEEGFCRCGCGTPTHIASVTVVARGHRKGYPQPYVKGHNAGTGKSPGRTCECGGTKSYRSLKCWHCRYPNPVPRMIGRPTPEERLWRRVDKTDGCWIWKGTSNNQGYGTIYYGDRKVLAHRLAWELTYGPIPLGAHVLHRCDTPRCVRPDHLWLGDAKANSDDKVAKGRQGTRAQPHLRPHDVREIRRLAAEGIRRRDIAVQFGICLPHAISIVTGRAWKNV